MVNVFDENYKKYDAWYEKNRPAYLSELKALRTVLPKTGKGLEIGVGTGRFSAPLGIRHGIDPSKNMLKRASRRGINVKHGVGERLPYANAAFDYVAIIIALCFVEDPGKVLAETRRVLKKSGKVIIGIVDKNSFLGRFYRKKKGIFYKQARFFGVGELAGLLAGTGFDRISCLQTMFDFPHKIRSTEKPRPGFGQGGFVVVSARKGRKVKQEIKPRPVGIIHTPWHSLS